MVTPEMVLAQVERYNQKDPTGHLYGAIIASVRDHIEAKKKGRYAEYHMAYCAHYVGDLSRSSIGQEIASGVLETVSVAKAK